jgi:hypothetical protein
LGGDLAGAQAKVAALENSLNPDAARLKQLKAELESTLADQIARLQSPLREALAALQNEAYRLVLDGDLAGAQAKVAALENSLNAASGPPSDTPPTLTQPTATAMPKSGAEEKQEKIKALHEDVSKLVKDINNPDFKAKIAAKVKELAAADPEGPEAKMMEALDGSPTDKEWEETITEVNNGHGPPEGVTRENASFEGRLFEVYKSISKAGSSLVNKLSPGELVAIRSYTDDLPPVPQHFKQINGMLIGYDKPQDDKKKQQLEQMVEQAKKALAKLEDHTAWPTKRGEKKWSGAEARYKQDNEFTIESFWSTGNGFAGEWQITVWGKTGKKVADASYFGEKEEEVLFPPGTKFKVIKVEQITSDKMSVDVKEV